jgi:hypothetical protein
MRLGTILSWAIIYTPLLASFLAAILYIDVIQGVSAIHDVNVGGSEDNSFPGVNHDLNLRVTTDGGEDHDSSGGVSSEFPSCAHTFGLIKVENTVSGNTKYARIQMDIISYISLLSLTSQLGPILVIPKHKTEELTIWNVETSQSVQEQVPQLQAAAFGKRKLTVAPGASARLPFSFFPQFPSRHHKLEAMDGERIIQDQSVHMSRDSVLDLASILTIDPMEVGRLQVHNVETHVKVDSSRGTYWTKFHNSAVRSNPFHLPHTIVFERDGFVHSDMIHVEGDRAEYRKATKKESVAYEYDIYIDNPSEENHMSILDVYPSKPEFVEVVYHHESGKRSDDDDEGGYYRFNNCGYGLLDILHCNSPVSLESTGPSVLPPGARRVYVGTIQFKKELVSNDGGFLEDIDELFLGYLYIRIEHRSTLLLAIALDYVSDGTDFDDQSLDVVPDDKEVDGLVNDESEALGAILHDEAMHDSIGDNGIGMMEGRLDECDVNVINGPIKVSQGPHDFATKSHQFVVRLPHSQKKTSSQPPLDFGLITGDEEERALYVTVQNTGDTSLRLMHSSILFKKLDEHKVDTTMPVMEEYKLSKMIPPNETIQDAVKISLKSDVLTGFCEDKCHLPGIVILRFGPSWMSYHEWIYAIMDDPMKWESFSVELPFVIRIIHGYLEYDASKIFFPAQVDQNSVQKSDMCQKSFYRNIFLRNMFSVPITLRRLKVQGLDEGSDHLSSKFCDDHFSVVGVRAPNESNLGFPIVSLPGESWGNIGLVYKFPEDDNNELRSMKDPKNCFLAMFTDEAGIFHVPLWIYKSEVKAHVEESSTPTECQTGKVNSSTLTGMHCLHAIRRARHFESIVNLMTKVSGDKEANGKLSEGLWISEMERYFLSLTNDTGSKVTSVDPIVLSYGAIATGTAKSRHIFLSNRNPLPINITVEVPACEGMEIVLTDVATRHVNYTTYTNSIENQGFAIESLESMGMSDRIFRTMKQFYDISPSTILDSILNKLFETKLPSSLRMEDAITMSPTHSPPDFSNETLRKAFKSNCLGPLLVTLDDDMAYKLNNIEGNLESVSSWTVPPGGVAAFHVVIRAPSTNALLNRNYADMLSSGILLKTNSGQLIPVVSTYRALSGHFLIGPAHEVHARGNMKSLHVPFTIGYESKMIGTSKAENDDSVEVRIFNNFSSAVLVKEIRSCNHFFRFDTAFGVLPRFIKTGESFVASVSVNIDCSGRKIDTDGSYHSFYKCALALFEEGIIAAKNGCRSNVSELYSESSKHNQGILSDDTVKIRVIDTLKRAIGFMDMKHSAREIDGNKKVLNRFKSINEMKHPIDHIGPIVIDQAQKEWAVLAKLGMNAIQGFVEAEFEFLDGESEETSTMISLIPSTVFESTLTLPRLSRITNKFRTTPVGEISVLYIPIKNPTGYPVKLKIIGERNSQFYIHSPNRKDAWWTGGAYYIPDDRQGIFLQSRQNVTVNSMGGSLFGLYSPSLHSTTALLQSCSGRYCGFNVSEEEKNKRMNGRKMQATHPIGASSVVGYCLTGSMCDEGGHILKHPTNNTGQDFNYFAFAESDMNEITLPPYGVTKLGPFYFRPRSKGAFSGFLLLENSLTGYEVLGFNGIGSDGNIAFFDSKNGGTIELRNGKSALVLNGGHGANKSRKMTTAILVGNLGGLDVQVLSVYLSFPTASVHGENDEQKMCHLRGFTLSECNCKYGQNEECGIKSFVLKSKTSKVFHIYHQNDCAFQSKHVNLIVAYKNGKGSSHIKKAELTIVYEMNDVDVFSCSAEAKSLFSALGRRGSMTKAMVSKVFLNFFSILLSMVIFVALLWDMISSTMRKYAAMVKFRTSINSLLRKHKSKRTGYKSWFSAYRCLACADPTSFELTQLGKEQTRQMLLNTYRKECMIQPHCILPNGTFVRQRRRASDSVEVVASQQQTNSVSITMNKIMFSNCMFFKKIAMTDIVPTLPCGLNWRVMSSIRNIRNKSTLTTETTTCSKQKSKEEENPDSCDIAFRIPETHVPISDQGSVKAIPPLDSGKQDRMTPIQTNSFEGEVTRNIAEIHPKDSDRSVSEDVVLHVRNEVVYVSSDGSLKSDDFEATITEITLHGTEYSPTRQSENNLKSIPEVMDCTVKSSPNPISETTAESKATLLVVDTFDKMSNCHNSDNELEQDKVTFHSDESKAKNVSTVSNISPDSDEWSTNRPPEFGESIIDTSTEKLCESFDESCDQIPALTNEEEKNKSQDDKVKNWTPGRRSRNRGRKKRKLKRCPQDDSLEGSSRCTTEGDRHNDNQEEQSPKSGLVSSKNATNDCVALIRPPPGLVPPPGFCESHHVSSFTENVQIASIAGAIPDSNQEHNAISNSALLANVLDDNNADSLNLLKSGDTDRQENYLSSASLDETSQIANVMSFFNFLDDSYDHVDSGRNINEDNDDHRQRHKEDAGHEAIPLYGNLNPEFPTNLWSDSSHGTPRTIPFGFNIGNHQAKWIDDDDVAFTPLSTTKVILGPTADNDGDQRNGDNPFDADAFFSGLLE